MSVTTSRPSRPSWPTAAGPGCWAPCWEAGPCRRPGWPWPPAAPPRAWGAGAPCRYYRLAGPGVAEALEALSVLAPKTVPTGEGAQTIDSLRMARTCYDHLAGRLGVLLTGAMVRRRFLLPRRREVRPPPSGDAVLAEPQ